MANWERLQEELEDAQRESLENHPIIEPTPEEVKNGWDSKSLTKYLAERNAGQSINIDINSLHRQVIPNEQNHKYRVKRWRE